MIRQCDIDTAVPYRHYLEHYLKTFPECRDGKAILLREKRQEDERHFEMLVVVDRRWTRKAFKTSHDDTRVYWNFVCCQRTGYRQLLDAIVSYDRLDKRPRPDYFYWDFYRFFRWLPRNPDSPRFTMLVHTEEDVPPGDLPLQEPRYRVHNVLTAENGDYKVQELWTPESDGDCYWDMEEINENDVDVFDPIFCASENKRHSVNVKKKKKRDVSS